MVGTSAEPPCDDIPGIRLEEEIAYGPFGSVWKAVDVNLNVSRAVKFPNLGRQFDEKRFFQEAQLMAQVNDDSVVTVHRVDVCGGGTIPYIVLEYMAGGSLEDRLVHEGIQDPLATMRIGVDIGRALEAVHRHLDRPVHGDMAPRNVLFDEHGRAHLSDFGLAQMLRGNRLGQREGATLGFAAPEVLILGEVRHASDVWGLAATLCWAMTAIKPFEGQTEEAIRERMADGAPNLPECPEPFRELLRVSLSEEPDDRPTAAQFATDLEEILMKETNKPDLNDPMPAPALDPAVVGGPSSDAPAEGVDLFDLCSAVTFKLDIPNVDGAQVEGTGVLVSADGIVATSASLVENAKGRRQISAHDTNGVRHTGEILKYVKGLTLNLDRGLPGVDVAFIRLDGPSSLPTLEPPELKSEGRPGEEVVAIGNSFGHPFTYNDGAIRAFSNDPTGWIMHSVALNKADVGGPLFDRRGRLLGLNSWMRRIGEASSYALPTQVVLKELDELRAELAKDGQNRLECCLACGRRTLEKRQERDSSTGRDRQISECSVCGSREVGDTLHVGFAPITIPQRVMRENTAVLLADEFERLIEFPAGTTSRIKHPNGVRADTEATDVEGNPAGLASFIQLVTVGLATELVGTPKAEYWWAMTTAVDELRIVRSDPFAKNLFSVPGIGPTSVVHAAAAMVGASAFYLRHALVDPAGLRSLFNLRKQRIEDLTSRGRSPAALGEHPAGPALVAELGVLAYRAWAMCGPDGRAADDSDVYQAWHHWLSYYIGRQEELALRARDQLDQYRGAAQNRIDLDDALYSRRRIDSGRNPLEVARESQLSNLAAMDGYLLAMAKTLCPSVDAPGLSNDKGAQAVANGLQEIEARQRQIRREIETLTEGLRVGQG